MFESPSKQKDQQIDVATLAVSCMRLNGSLFNHLRSECKLTHLHVRPLIGSRQKKSALSSRGGTMPSVCWTVVEDNRTRWVRVGLYVNAALVCNADRTCQQMKPNERHLCYSLEWLLTAQDQERTGGPLRVMRQRHLRPSPALRLTLQVTGTSDKMLSRTDLN